MHTGAHFGPVQIAVAHLSAATSIGVEWEEVVEISVGCFEGLRVRELDGKPGPPIVDRGGQYRLRLSVSGRAAGAKRYSSSVRAKVLETYLFELWPAAAEPVRVLREVEPVEDKPVVLHHERAGRQAAARLTEEIVSGPSPRTLTGVTGTVSTSYNFVGTARRLFSAFANLDQWLVGGGSGSEPRRDDDGRVHGGYICSGLLDNELRRRPDHLSDGCVWGEFLDFARPKFVVSSWNWRVCPIISDPGSWDTWRWALPVPATLRVDLTQNRADGVTSTRIDITHSDLPIKWCPDMTAFWDWKLESAAKEWIN